MKTPNPYQEEISKDSTLEKNVSIGNNFFSMIAAIFTIIGGLYGAYQWHEARKNADTPGGKVSVQSDVTHQEKASSLPLPEPSAHQGPKGRDTHPDPMVNPPQGQGNVADKKRVPEITHAEKKLDQPIANPNGVQESVLAKKKEATQKRYAGLINRRYRNKDGLMDVGIFIKKGSSLDTKFADQLANASLSLGIGASTRVFTAGAVQRYDDFYDGTPSFLKETGLTDEVDYYIIGEIETATGPNPFVEGMKTATIHFEGRLILLKDGSLTTLDMEPEREVGFSDQDALREAYKSFAQKLAEEVRKHL